MIIYLVKECELPEITNGIVPPNPKLECASSYTYQCEPDYETSDPTTVTCGDDKTLSPAPPTCESKFSGYIFLLQV